MKTPLHQLSAKEAREFFLRQDSYCNFDLPSYFVFEKLLYDSISEHDRDGGQSIEQWKTKPKKDEDVNYRLLMSKDGLYDWREFQLAHPLIYTALIWVITQECNWEFILERFSSLADERIAVASQQLVHDTSVWNEQTETDILNWWEQVEQMSVAYSLKYRFMGTTDIANCYPSIYTHSIAWALHGRSEAKEKRQPKQLLGNRLDDLFQQMNAGQTNGIPQGNRVSDFVAELVLAYCDSLLLEAIDNEAKLVGSLDFAIIRYRDDYRIFSNSASTIEEVLRQLTLAAGQLNLKLNKNKTNISENVIRSAIKPDKLAYKTGTAKKDSPKAIQTNLLRIFEFSQKYPSSGSLMRMLSDFRKDLDILDREPLQIRSLVAIIVEIMRNNPRTYAVGAAILSKLISFEEDSDEIVGIVDDVRSKFEQMPNVGHLLIWLQRLTVSIDRSKSYDDRLCEVVSAKPDEVVHPWSHSWIPDLSLQKRLSQIPIVDQRKIDSLGIVIPRSETQIFDVEY